MLAYALTACAGPPARGQSTAVPSIGSVAPNIYEVAPEQIPAAQEAGFIEVSSAATVEVASDQAQISFAMETRAETADDAAVANADAMDRVLATLRSGGFAELDLQTFGYSLQPEYAIDNVTRVRSIAGYLALNNVRATVADVDQVGRLIDVAITAGANRVSSISFSASDTGPARAQALADAVRNARAQAEVIAQALGHELGAPLEIRGGAQRPAPRRVEAMRLATQAAAATTPIEAADQTVGANVTIRFALGPELAGR